MRDWRKSTSEELTQYAESAEYAKKGQVNQIADFAYSALAVCTPENDSQQSHQNERLSTIPCQARIPAICGGSHAPTTMVQPKRFGESLSDNHQAALCGPCRRQIQRRDKSQSIQTENDFLWAVLRTETIRGLYERS